MMWVNCIQFKTKKKSEKNLFRTVHYLFSKACDLSRTEKETETTAVAEARSQEQLFRQRTEDEGKSGAKTNG